ncbi:hypothetical protein KIPB_000425 [Kipferlia bialata]|uniref:SWIM-type domain-containing protein n=1 Tax=Kipferlia bialata TaxID=797122 RepID=A0A9K3CMH6_9EUKA|nr:hypothetical protein KIPB_000425 [Kipferlia bialata]|eukprot:g425.t1
MLMPPESPLLADALVTVPFHVFPIPHGVVSNPDGVIPGLDLVNQVDRSTIVASNHAFRYIQHPDGERHGLVRTEESRDCTMATVMTDNNTHYAVAVRVSYYARDQPGEQTMERNGFCTCPEYAAYQVHDLTQPPPYLCKHQAALLLAGSSMMFSRSLPAVVPKALMGTEVFWCQEAPYTGKGYPVVAGAPPARPGAVGGQAHDQSESVARQLTAVFHPHIEALDKAQARAMREKQLQDRMRREKRRQTEQRERERNQQNIVNPEPDRELLREEESRLIKQHPQSPIPTLSPQTTPFRLPVIEVAMLRKFCQPGACGRGMALQDVGAASLVECENHAFAGGSPDAWQGVSCQFTARGRVKDHSMTHTALIHHKTPSVLGVPGPVATWGKCTCQMGSISIAGFCKHQVCVLLEVSGKEVTGDAVTIPYGVRAGPGYIYQGQQDDAGVSVSAPPPPQQPSAKRKAI